MKKVFAALLLLSIGFISCTKERVDEPRTKTTYKTYYFRVDGIEDGGTYSSTIGTIRIKQN